MSTQDQALVVLNNNEQALASGGLGFEAASRLFEVKPGWTEVVQTSSKQENVTPGMIRDTSTNEHFEARQIVLLAFPTERRQYFEEGTKDMSKDKKLCFSLDNVEPHAKAKKPQAMKCATCVKGDINWKKWRETHNSRDLPPCKKYWNIFYADRSTQLPFYHDVKGKGVTPFENDMKQLARIFAQLRANVVAQNKQIDKDNAKALQETPAEGKTPTLKPHLPLPNLFDITFTVYVTQETKNDPFILRCKDFKQLSEEGKKDFGALFLQFAQRQAEFQEQAAAHVEAEAQTEVLTESAPVANDPLNVVGEVLPPSDKPQITI